MRSDDILVFDKNRDGYPDTFVPDAASAEKIKVYLGNGTGTFTEAVRLLGDGDSAANSAMVTFDSDGKGLRRRREVVPWLFHAAPPAAATRPEAKLTRWSPPKSG